MKEDRIKIVKRNKRKFFVSILLIDLFLIILMYFITPKIQLFPPESEDFRFQEKVQVLTHVQQYSLIFVFGGMIHILAYEIIMRNINKYLKRYVKNEKIDYKTILKIRSDCQSIPYKMLIIEWFIFVGIGVILNFIMLIQEVAIIKFTLMIMALASLITLCSFIATKNYLGKIIDTTYELTNKYEQYNGIRVTTKISLVIQAVPLVLAMLIIPILFGYSNSVKEKGIGIANYYKVYLNNISYPSEINEITLKDSLNKIPLYNEDNYYFIIGPNDKKIYVSNKQGEISSFVLDYRDFFFKGNEGMLYEKFGEDEQLYTKKIVDNKGQVWYIGFKFQIIDKELLYYDISLIGVVLLTTIIFIFMWAKNFNKDSDRISKQLKVILNSKAIKKENIIPLMSNDELSDLAYYYNKIQERLISQEDIIALQSKFSAIGEVAAGMAHDINNPASAIEGTINLLYDFKVDSDEESYKALLDNMKVAINRILSIVNNAREQFRNHDKNEKEKFSLKELLQSIKCAEESNLVKNKCSLDILINEDIEIYGIKSKLYQVISNIIRNDINAYKDNNRYGSIEIDAKKENENIIITIKDEAGGIPEEIKDTLFKKIITTRGTKGTGLGLYLAGNIVEIDYKGKISFDSELGKGTIFYIKLLNNKEDE